MRGKGVSILNVQGIKKVNKEKEARKQKVKQLGEEGKEVVGKMLEEQIAKALIYLKDEKNREKVISTGIAIAQMVIKVATKKK